MSGVVTDDADVLFDDLERFVERVTVGVASAVHASLTELAPVDTGHSRANWLVSIGSPRGDVVGDKENVAFGAGERSMDQVAGTWRLFMDDIWIANNVDYVVILNRRHPAATGFVEISINRAMRIGPGVASESG